MHGKYIFFQDCKRFTMTFGINSDETEVLMLNTYTCLRIVKDKTKKNMHLKYVFMCRTQHALCAVVQYAILHIHTFKTRECAINNNIIRYYVSVCVRES